jgi:flagellar assembly protein FliH
MDLSSLPPDQVASLITQILNEKDPATVGLRRIIRRKTVEAEDFPMRAPAIEDFSTPGKAKKLLTEDERRIIELERQVKGLREELAKQNLNARQVVDKTYRKGFDEGRGTGVAQGRAEAGAEYQKKIEAVQNQTASYLQNIEDAKRAIFANADRIILSLCNRMAKKILSVEVAERSDVVLKVLRTALTYVAEREKITIRVAPGDLEAVSGNKDFWAPITERLKAITIEPDERIEKGGCIIESTSGIVDARLDIQMNELSELIEKTWESTYTSTNSQETARE